MCDPNYMAKVGYRCPVWEMGFGICQMVPRRAVHFREFAGFRAGKRTEAVAFQTGVVLFQLFPTGFVLGYENAFDHEAPHFRRFR
jgi:hypothetical protein